MPERANLPHGFSLSKLQMSLPLQSFMKAEFPPLEQDFLAMLTSDYCPSLVQVEVKKLPVSLPYIFWHEYTATVPGSNSDSLDMGMSLVFMGVGGGGLTQLSGVLGDDGWVNDSASMK